MPILSQTEMFKCVLETMAAYPEFSRMKAKQVVCDKLGLSREEQEQRTSSGVAVYESRVGWAVSWLNEAGYLVRIRRGMYTVSDAGGKILNSQLDSKAFVARMTLDRSVHLKESDLTADQTVLTIEENIEKIDVLNEMNPIERVDAAVAEWQEQVAYEIMNAIMSIEGRTGDTFFEKIVTDLLEKMGYGKGIVTPASNDGGIDGVIRTDPLGFNPIFIQAKRYKAEHVVSRPELQSFAGALGAVTRGAFITTSRFSASAVEYAKNYPHADIVLIDGKLLTDLMIQYNVGVSVVRDVSIKQIDNNYFDQ